MKARTSIALAAAALLAGVSAASAVGITVERRHKNGAAQRTFR